MRLVGYWQLEKVSGLQIVVLDPWMVMLTPLDLGMIPEVMKVLEKLVTVVVMILEFPPLYLMPYQDVFLQTDQRCREI